MKSRQITTEFRGLSESRLNIHLEFSRHYTDALTSEHQVTDDSFRVKPGAWVRLQSTIFYNIYSYLKYLIRKYVKRKTIRSKI